MSHFRNGRYTGKVHRSARKRKILDVTYTRQCRDLLLLHVKASGFYFWTRALCMCLCVGYATNRMREFHIARRYDLIPEMCSKVCNCLEVMMVEGDDVPLSY